MPAPDDAESPEMGNVPREPLQAVVELLRQYASKQADPTEWLADALDTHATGAEPPFVHVACVTHEYGSTSWAATSSTFLNRAVQKFVAEWSTIPLPDDPDDEDYVTNYFENSPDETYNRGVTQLHATLP